MDSELLLANLAALTAVPGVGRRTLARIFYSRKKYQWSWKQFWVCNTEIVKKIPVSEKLVLAIQNWKKDHNILDFYTALEEKNIRVIIIGSKEYPPLLAQSDRPPVLLFVKGASLDRLARLPIAVVGTRQVTSYGRSVTTQITAQLCRAGASIISGCMYGVDTVAHQAALAAHSPTVAVLGFGFDHVYPVTQQPVLDAIIAAGGSIISEYPPDTRPTKGNFIARNSIVAGMSRAVLVTEAAQRSGSHTTAQFALESGRSVCAVPGPIYSQYSEGTKWLINEGAVLVSSAEDVLQELGIGTVQGKTAVPQEKPAPSDPLERKILAVLQTGAQLSEELFSRLDCTFAEYQVCLMRLELGNYLERSGEVVRICY